MFSKWTNGLLGLDTVKISIGESCCYKGSLSLDQHNPTCRGFLVFPNKDTFEGTFQSDTIDGVGSLRYSCGDTFVGEFVQGKLSGEGSITFNDGSNYQGNFLNGEINGKGVFHYSNGDVYKGCFATGSKHGFGKYTFANGVSFSGDYDNDEPTTAWSKAVDYGDSVVAFDTRPSRDLQRSQSPYTLQVIISPSSYFSDLFYLINAKFFPFIYFSVYFYLEFTFVIVIFCLKGAQ